MRRAEAHRTVDAEIACCHGKSVFARLGHQLAHPLYGIAEILEMRPIAASDEALRIEQLKVGDAQAWRAPMSRSSSRFGPQGHALAAAHHHSLHRRRAPRSTCPCGPCRNRSAPECRPSAKSLYLPTDTG